MYKEIKFTGQKGYGLAVTNPSTHVRALVGIFSTYQEAKDCGEFRRQAGRVLRPFVVPWNRRNYNKYDYVFLK